MQKSRSFDLAKNIRLIGLIFAAPSPFKDTCAKKKVTLLEFQDILFQKRATNGSSVSSPLGLRGSEFIRLDFAKKSL